MASERDVLMFVAHRSVKDAVQDGRLPHPSSLICVDCGAAAEQYDHRDLTRPLDVVPVCRGCNNRRGPAFPLPTKEDNEHIKRPHTEKIASAGRCWSNVQSEPLTTVTYVPAGSTTVAGSGAEWTNPAVADKQFIGEATAVERYRFFKQHDPWYEPDPLEIDWGT